MTMRKITVVHCDDTEAKYSRFSECNLESSQIDERVFESVDQELEAGAERELHNAAHHSEFGPVTYVQQVHEGGFAVFAGKPDELEERFFDAGSWVAFMDDEGPGHGSKVGPNGVKRTLRVLKGHLDL